jgi:PKD repeat protein
MFLSIFYTLATIIVDDRTGTMDNKPGFHRIKANNPWKYVLLWGILVLLIPQLVSGGNTGTAEVTGNVLQSPVAMFTANVTQGTAPLSVEFRDLSTNHPVSWQWDFGDGTNSTGQNPTHTYANGNYSVNLTVTNAAGTSTNISENYIIALPATGPSQFLQLLDIGSRPISYDNGGVSPAGVIIENGPPQSVHEISPVLVQAPGQVPPGGTYLLAPLEKGPVSQTIDLSPYSRFMYLDSSGKPFATIDRAEAEQAGATVSMSGNMVEIIRPEFTLSITAGKMSETNGLIWADNIQSILLANTPLEADVDGVGPVTSSFTAGLATLPLNAGLRNFIGEPADPSVTEAFRLAVAHAGDEIQAIAYTLTVQKTDIAVASPATITMSVPAGWVTAHGGAGSIVIGRLADDQTCTILQTSFSGYARNGNMEFVAKSPGGLSVFALIATNGSLQTRMGQPTWMNLMLQDPVLSPILGTTNSSFVTVGGLSVVVLVIFIILATACCIIWRIRKNRVKRSGRPDKSEGEQKR